MENELTKRILTSIIVISASFFCIIVGSTIFNIFIFLVFFISLFEWFNLCKKKTYLIIGVCFFSISIISAYNLRNDNVLFFLFAILISAFTDMGGFITGKIFKGPKLTKISPNKTYSGSVGSFIFSILSGLIFIKYFDKTFMINLKININELIAIILLLSAVSQIGDLTISYFKRLKNIKNTGKILPGHGGLLDRIDGLIFSIPCSYIIFNYLSY
jgi:phosphatidate cytidylyltransferase